MSAISLRSWSGAKKKWGCDLKLPAAVSMKHTCPKMQSRPTGNFKKSHSPR